MSSNSVLRTPSPSLFRHQSSHVKVVGHAARVIRRQHYQKLFWDQSSHLLSISKILATVLEQPANHASDLTYSALFTVLYAEATSWNNSPKLIIQRPEILQNVITIVHLIHGMELFSGGYEIALCTV